VGLFHVHEEGRGLRGSAPIMERRSPKLIPRSA
jgi:hypothetical protein